MLSYLRTRAFSQGLLGGSRFWLGLGAIVWTIRFFQWLGRSETEIVYRAPLGRGESVVISQSAETLSRRQRKKAARRAQAEADALRRQAKIDRRAARRRRGGVAAGAA
jgi:hypothetical protein